MAKVEFAGGGEYPKKVKKKGPGGAVFFPFPLRGTNERGRATTTGLPVALGWACSDPEKVRCHLAPSRQHGPQRLARDVRGLIAVVAEPPAASSIVDRDMRHEFQPREAP